MSTSKWGQCFKCKARRPDVRCYGHRSVGLHGQSRAVQTCLACTKDEHLSFAELERKKVLVEAAAKAREAGAALVKTVEEAKKVCPYCGETWIVLHECKPPTEPILFKDWRPLP